MKSFGDVLNGRTRTVPEIIDPVFAKTSQNARFLLSENERFGLVFVKTGSINSGTGKGRFVLASQFTPPHSPDWAEFTIMMECTPESGHCQSICTLSSVV